MRFIRRPGAALSAAVGLALAAIATHPAMAADAYVGSEGANTIFTDYYANPTTRIELDFQYTTGGGMVVGPWNGGSGLRTALWNAGAGNGGLQFIVGDDGSHKSVASGHTLSTARRFLAIDCHTGKLYIATHGAATTNEVESGTTFSKTANWPVSLLGASKSTDGSAVDEGQFAKARIYGCKIYEWNETTSGYDLVRDYVPVLRDGIPCLRDSVTGSVARDVRNEVPTLRYGGDIEEVGHGYIQLVATSGDVGINTGYHVKDCSRIELDAALGSASTVVRPMGCWQRASTLQELVWTSGNKVIFFINGNQQTTGLSTDTNRHTFVIDQKNSEGRYYNDGSTVLLKKVVGTTAAVSGATSTHPLSIFGDTGNVAGTEWAQSAYGMKCYGLKIYENDILVTNFVPCVKNGYPGFKDLISGEFVSAGKYKNDFVAMGNFIVEGNDGQTARDAYVESDGTQVLNTGYHITKNSRIEIEFALVSPKKGFVCGNYKNDASLNWSIWINGSGANERLQFSGIGSGSNNYFGSAPGTSRVKAVYDAKNLVGWVERAGVVDGAKTPLKTDGSGREDACRWPMGVFGSLQSADGTAVDTTLGASDTGGGIPMRVYSVRIYEADELAAEFLPYEGKEGVGLYNTKTGKLALKHSASVADPAIGGMGVDGAEKWLVEPAATTVVPADGSATVTAKACGKVVRYIWTLGGETLADTDDSIAVVWRTGTRGLPVAGTVTPIYEVFGNEVTGAPVAFNVTFNPKAFVMVVR